MTDSDIHHLAAAYALDALDASERAAYEAHFPTCEICRADVAEFRATLAELGATTNTPPPPDVKRRVMAEIATTRQLSPLPTTVVRPSEGLSERRPRRVVVTALAIAAAAVCFLAGAVIFGARNDSFGDELAAMMDEPGFTMVELTGEGSGSIQVAWTPRQAAVIGGDLPDPGEGRRYELWMIDDAGAHAMDMLDPADGGTVRRMLAVDGEPVAWGVTIEPASGSTVPTEPVLFQAEA